MFHRLVLCVLFEGLTWMMQLGSTWKSAGTFSHKLFWSLFFLQSAHSITWGWINLSIRETEPFNNSLIIYKCFACFCFVVLGWGGLLPYHIFIFFEYFYLWKEANSAFVKDENLYFTKRIGLYWKSFDSFKAK